MAAGKVVVGHVIPEVRQIVHDNTGMSLPVIEATPRSLSEVLKNLAQSADEISSLQVTSRNFVERVHNGHRSAEILMSHWVEKSAPQNPRGR